jgi:hypothetical protein
MATLSAVASTPYPAEAVGFHPVPTIADGDAPAYGFHFIKAKKTDLQCAFDNCANYNQSHFAADLTRRHHLLTRYELLFLHQTGRLAGKYYVVPWILVPEPGTTSVTVDLKVSALSIYDTESTELRKEIKEELKNKNRVLSLFVPGTPAIAAYWGSGTDTTIDEKNLKDDQKVRIEIPVAQYLSGQAIEVTREVRILAGTDLLGKLRISIVKKLAQHVCFLKVQWSTTTSQFEARVLPLTAIPGSLERPGTALHDSLRNALKPYCIDIDPLGDAAFLNSGTTVLMSGQVKFPLGADLKPADGLSDEEKRHSVDEKFANRLFSKLKQFKKSANSAALPIHGVIFITILPFYWTETQDNKVSGFSPDPALIDSSLTAPLHCYILPTGTYLYDDYTLNKKKYYPDFDEAKISVPSVSEPYLESTLVHEFLHTMQLGHTFPESADALQGLADFSQRMTDIDLTEFGDRAAGTTPSGSNLFEMLRDGDLRSALIDGYFVAELHRNDVLPPLSKGWLYMKHINENVFFTKYQTKSFMDYIAGHPTIRPSETPLKDLTIYIEASPVPQWLYRYQWEMARATAQFLASF